MYEAMKSTDGNREMHHDVEIPITTASPLLEVADRLSMNGFRGYYIGVNGDSIVCERDLRGFRPIKEKITIITKGY